MRRIFHAFNLFFKGIQLFASLEFGAIAGLYGEKIKRNCSQKEPKERNKIN
jgi:hypothetical protein